MIRLIHRAAATVLAIASAAALHAQTSLDACVRTASRGPATDRPRLPAVVPFTLRANHVAITVCRAGKAYTFLLDTGAGSSNFDLSTAQAAGIALGSSFRVGGAGGGTVAGARLDAESVVIPGADIPIPTSIAIDYSALSSVSGAALEGLVGADFLARYVVAIDYRHETLTIHDRDAFTYSGSGVAVPFTLSGPFIRVPGDVVLADGSTIGGSFVVDVGSSLPLALATRFVDANHLHERLGKTIRRPGGRGVGGESMVDVGRIASLSIGGIVLPSVITMLHSDTAGAFANPALGDGNIGGDILRRFTVYFDYARRRLIFEKHDGSAEPFEADMSGLQLSISNDRSRFVADFVVAKSPAEDAGISAGDEIVAVDGTPVAASMLDGLRLRMRTAGRTIAFTVARPTGNVTVHVTTRRII